MGFGFEEEWDFDPLDLQYDYENYSVWAGQDGARYKVSEMTVSHLRNCIRCIEQERFRHDWLLAHGDDWLEVFVGELASRPPNTGIEI